MDYERQKKVISDYAAALAYADEEGVKKGVKKQNSYFKELLKQGLSHEELLKRLDER